VLVVPQGENPTGLRFRAAARLARSLWALSLALTALGAPNKTIVEKPRSMGRSDRVAYG
jgi:hypothetical protein